MTEEPKEEKEETKEEIKEREKVEAKELVERQEKANAETKELLDRQDKEKVEKEIGGQADAGQQKKEDTPQEYAKKVLEGTIDGTENK